MTNWLYRALLTTFLLISTLTAADATETDNNDASKPVDKSALSETYLPVAAAAGAARWPANRLPVTYHINDNPKVDGYRPSFKAAVEDAMAAWSKASGGKISFQSDDAAKAALLIAWTSDPAKMNVSRELGHAEVICDNAGILKGDILFLTRQVNGQTIGDSFARRVAMHEIGHALGILGHSPNSEDVMYASTTPSENPSLSIKDANTLMVLYSPAGDSFVRNIDLTKITAVGSSASPQLQAAHLNAEANEALKTMQFAVAIEKLEQAHRIDPSNQVIITNLGGTYSNVAAMAMMMRKTQDADNYFKKSIAILEKATNRSALLPVLTNYSTVLKSTGRVDEGNKIDARIRAIAAGN